MDVLRRNKRVVSGFDARTVCCQDRPLDALMPAGGLALRDSSPDGLPAVATAAVSYRRMA